MISVRARSLAALLALSLLVAPALAACSSKTKAETKKAPVAPAEGPSEETKLLQDFVSKSFGQYESSGNSWFDAISEVEVLDGEKKLAIARTKFDSEYQPDGDDLKSIADYLMRNDVVAVDGVRVLDANGALLLAQDRE